MRISKRHWWSFDTAQDIFDWVNKDSEINCLPETFITHIFPYFHRHILDIDVTSSVINCLYLSGERGRLLQSTNSGPTTTTSSIGGDSREFKRGGECEKQQSGLLYGDLKTLQTGVN